MKIDMVLTSCNLVEKYVSNYPIIFRVWRERFSLDCYLILISDHIPDFLSAYKKEFILLYLDFSFYLPST